MAVKIFFCYAHEDEALLNKLKLHLKPMQREGRDVLSRRIKNFVPFLMQSKKETLKKLNRHLLCTFAMQQMSHTMSCKINQTHPTHKRFFPCGKKKRDRSLSWGKHDRCTQIRGVWGKSWVQNTASASGKDGSMELMTLYATSH